MGAGSVLGALDAGSIPDPAQWVKDSALRPLQLRSQLWLMNSIGCGAAKKKKRNTGCWSAHSLLSQMNDPPEKMVVGECKLSLMSPGPHTQQRAWMGWSQTV